MVLVNNMKYRIKHEKSNKIFMTSVIILCLVTCMFWFILREYIYFSVYLFLTLLISYIYYFTYYYLKEEYLVIILGFIKVKIKYQKIIKIENLKNSVKLYFNGLSMDIYPNNKDIFYADMLDKMKGNK